MKKVLFISTGFFPLTNGVRMLYYSLYRSLVAQGLDVTVLDITERSAEAVLAPERLEFLPRLGLQMPEKYRFITVDPREKVKAFSKKFTISYSEYYDLKTIVTQAAIDHVNGMILDYDACYIMSPLLMDLIPEIHYMSTPVFYYDVDQLTSFIDDHQMKIESLNRELAVKAKVARYYVSGNQQTHRFDPNVRTLKPIFSMLSDAGKNERYNSSYAKNHIVGFSGAPGWVQSNQQFSENVAESLLSLKLGVSNITLSNPTADQLNAAQMDLFAQINVFHQRTGISVKTFYNLYHCTPILSTKSALQSVGLRQGNPMYDYLVLNSVTETGFDIDAVRDEITKKLEVLRADRTLVGSWMVDLRNKLLREEREEVSQLIADLNAVT